MNTVTIRAGKRRRRRTMPVVYVVILWMQGRLR